MNNIKKYNKTILFILAALILTFTLGYLIWQYHYNNNKIIPTNNELKVTELKALETIKVGEIKKFETATSTKENESVYLVKGKGYLTLRDSKITKSTGESTNLEESLLYGLNSAIVTTYDTTAKIFTSTIETNVLGASGVFSSGRKSKIMLSDTKINTLKNKSATLIASDSGYINGNALILTTKTKDSPALVTNDKVSFITIKDSLAETNGSGSPVIKAKGKITLDNTTGTANGSHIAILNDNANVTINNSTMLASGGSNNKLTPHSGVVIENGENTITVNNSSFNINKDFPFYNIAPIFFINNTKTNINLTNSRLNTGSNKLAAITKSNVNITCSNQDLKGNITIDKNSTLNLNLKDKSMFRGSITNSNTTITIDNNSILSLTADTYIKELNNQDKQNTNIMFNGHKLYVNNKPIN